MGKTKGLTKKQIQRTELNKVIDFNEQKLVEMQQKDWKDLDCTEINILENFLAVAIGTMRTCPPAYVIVASSNVVVRARSIEAINLITKPDGGVAQEAKPDPASGVQAGAPQPLVIDYGTDEKGNVYYQAGEIPVKDVDAEHS